MEKRAAMLQIFLLTAIVAGALSVPVKNDRCSQECTETTKHGYQEGTTYEYSYEGQTITKLEGSSLEHAALFIKANAKFEVISKCEFALKLANVVLEEADTRDLRRRSRVSGINDFKRRLEASAIKFSFQDGKILDVCASPYDPTWVVNIKRGIISAFQNSMVHFDHDHSVTETDVSGHCEANYKITRDEAEGKTFSKHKNLLGCMDRDRYVSVLRGTPYTADSSIQSLPVMKSFHDCEITTDRQGVLTKSECKENHVFRPFSNDKSGASTKTQQTLTMSGRKRGTPSANEECSRRTTLLFEHTEAPEMIAAAEQVTEILNNVCITDDVRPDTPAIFSRLVYALRNMNKAAIERVMASVHQGRTGCPTAGKFLHDAIPMVGTAASISVIRDSVLSGHVVDNEAGAWLASLAFVSNVNKDMVMNVRSLLQKVDRQKAVLTASALVNAYCKSTDCQEDTDIKDMVKSVVTLLSRTSNDEQKLIILKALANMGVHTDNINRIFREATDAGNPIELRVAAMHALHKMSCQQSRQTLLPIFMKTEEDSEIRINAYLALMKCPTMDLLDKVISVINQEEVNHVMSFVVTHLNNLQETSDLFSQKIREMLDGKKLKKTIESKKGMLSKNYEGSLFSDMLNLGGKAESNLIWSSQSYVPRSANLNFTVDLFGQSINLLEVGGRVEGAEALMEKLFGDEGYFKDSPLSEMIAKAKNSAQGKRTPLKASMYMKLFGNELRYLQIGNDNVKNAERKLNLLDIMTVFAKGTELKYDKNFMFLDMSYSLPTVVGLPIHMVVNGTISLRLGISGKMDMKSTDNVDIHAALKPSAAVQVASMFMVDAFVVKPGLKMVSTLHTSTQADASLVMRNKEILKADIKMPKDKLEFVDAETKFFIMHQGGEREQAMITEGRVNKQMCSGDILKKSLGLQLCGTLSFRNATNMDAPGFLLTGPAKAKIVLNRIDSDSGYSMQAQMRALRPEGSGPASAYVAYFSMDTPGSQIDRKMLFDFKLDKPSKTIELKMASPWKKFAAKGSLVNSMNNKHIEADVRIDGLKKMSVSAGLRTVKDGKTMKYMPNARLMLPGRKIITVEGMFVDKPGEVNEGELRINNITAEPILLKGSLTRDITTTLLRMDSTIDVSTPMSAVKGSLFVEMERGLLRTEADIVYKFGSRKRERLAFTGRMKNTKNRNSFRSVTNSELTMTQFPAYNFRVDFESGLKNRVAKTTVDIRYSGDFSNQKKRIYFNHAGSFETKQQIFQMNHEAQFTYKHFDLQFEGKLDHRHGPSEIKTSAVLNYNDETASFNVDMKKVSQRPLKLTGEINMAYPGREIRLRETLEQKSQNEFQNDFSLQWQRGSVVRSSAVFKMGDRSYGLKGTVTLPSKNIVEFESRLTPDINNFLASSKVAYKSKVYSGLFKYAYTRMNSLTANIDVLYPRRHITSDLMFTMKQNTYNVEFKTHWDADRNPKMKVVLDGSFRYLKDQELELTAVGTYIDHTGRLSVSHQKSNEDNIAHLKVFWDDKKSIEIDSKYKLRHTTNAGNVEVELTVKTPFRGYESQSGTVAYTRNKKNIQGRMSYTFSAGKTIVTDVNFSLDDAFRNMESTIEVTTPFNGYSNINMKANFIRQSGKFTSKVEYSRVGKKYEVDFKHEKTTNSFISSLKIGTPIKGFRTMELTVANELTRRNMKTDITGKIQRKAITVMLEGAYHSAQKMEGKMTLQTPFTEDILIQGKHNQNGGRVMTNGAIQWSNTEKIMVTNDLKYTSNSAEVKFQLATPYEVARSLDISLTHTGFKSLPVSTAVSINRNGDMTFSSRFQLSRVALLATLDLNSPDVMPIRFSLAYDKAKMPHTSKMMINWQEKTITLESELTVLGIDLVKGNLKLTTPYNPVKEVTLSLDHTKVNNEWRTAIETTRETDNQIQFLSTVSASRTTLKLQSTYRRMQNFQVNTRYASYLQSSFAMAHMASYGKTDFEFGMDCVVRQHKYSGFFKLDTPHKLVRDLYGKFSHEEKKGNYVTKIEGGYKQKNMKLDATWSVDSPKLNAVLTTPFNMMSKVTIEATHEGSWTSFSNNINVMVKSDKKRMFKSEMTVNSYNVIQGTVQLDEYVMSTFSHRMTRAQINSKIEMTVLSKRSDVDLQMTFGDVKGFTLKMNTPFKALKNLDTSGEYERKGMAIKANHNLDMNSSTRKLVAWTSLFELTRNKDSKFEFNLNSPLFKAGRVAFTFNHDMGQIHKTNMRLTYGNKAGSIKTSLNMNGNLTVDIETPFRGYQRIYVTSAYKKNGNSHTGQVILNYPNRRQINLEGLFSLKPITLELALKTPYDQCKDASLEFKHVGVPTDFSTTLLMKHNLLEKDILEKVVFKMTKRNVEIEKHLSSQMLSYQAAYKQRITRRDIDIEYQMTFTSPNVQNGKVSFTHKGLFDKFESEMEIAANNKKYLDLELSFDIDGYQTKIEFETAHQMMKKGELDFHHKASNRAFENGLKIKYNDEEATFSSDFKLENNKVEGKMMASGPFMKDLEITVTHTGLSANFQHVANVKYGKRQHRLEASLSTNAPMNGNLKLRSPLMKDFDITFNHNGNMRMFNNNLKAQYGSHIFQYTDNVDVRNKEGSIELKIPYQNTHVIVSHKSTGGKMATEVSVKYGNNKMYKLTSMIQASPVDIMMKLETPHSEVRTAQMELKFTNDASFRTVNLNMKMQLNDAELASLTATRKADTIEGRLMLQPNRQSLKQADINFKHEGRWNNFKTSSKAVADGTTYFDGEMTFSYDRILQTEVKVKTASRHFRDGRASIYYKMTKRVCDVKVIGSRNGRVIKSEINLKMKPSYELTAKLQTPYKYAKDLSVSVNHDPQAKRVVCDIEHKVQDMGIFKFNMNLEAGQNIQGTFFLRTPLRQVGDATLTFTHRGTITNFNNNIRLETVKGNAVYNGEFRMTNGAVGKFALTTPMNQLRNTQLEFNVNPKVGSILLKSGRTIDIKSRYSLRGSPSVTTNIRIQTPLKYLKNLEFNMDHQGKLSAFNSNMDLTYEETRLLSAQVQARKMPLNGNLVLSIHKLKDIKVEFNHRGNMDNMQAVGKIMYGRHTGQATMTFNMQPVINGKFTLESPFHQPVVMKLTHEGGIISFRNTMEGTYGSKSATVVTKLSYRGFSMEATTPVNGYENFNVELANNGDPLNFQMTAAVSFRYVNILKLTGEYKLSSNPRMGKFELVAPANNILLTVKHDGSWTIFNNNIDLTYNGKKYFEYESSMSQTPFERKVRMYTPLFDAGTMKMSVKHVGSWYNFHNTLKFSRNSMKYTVDTTLESDSMLNLKVEVTTPFTSVNNLKAILTHSGPIYDFKNSLSVVVNSNRVYSLTTVTKLHPTLEYSMKIETPNYKFREMELTFAHKGDIYKYFTTWAVSLNGERRAMWQATFDASEMEGTMIYKMPYRDDITGNFNVDGTLLNFSSSAEIGYGRKKAMASFGLTTSPVFSVDADFNTTQ